MNHMTYRGYTARMDFDADDKIIVGIMLRVNPAVHAAAVKASARSGQSLNKWAEKVLDRAAHA